MKSEEIEAEYLTFPNMDIWAEVISFVKQPYEEYYFDLFEFEKHSTDNPVKE